MVAYFQETPLTEEEPAKFGAHAPDEHHHLMKATEILKEIVNGIALNWWLGRARHHSHGRLMCLGILEDLRQGRIPRSHEHHDGDTPLECHYAFLPGVQRMAGAQGTESSERPKLALCLGGRGDAPLERATEGRIGRHRRSGHPGDALTNNGMVGRAG